MRAVELLAVSGSVLELLTVVFIVLVPTVPATVYAWILLRRRTGRGQEIESGRSSATPFAVISYVGTAIAVVAVLTLLLVVAIRAAAT